MLAQPMSGLSRLSRPWPSALVLSSGQSEPIRRRRAAATRTVSYGACQLCSLRPAVRGRQRMAAISSQGSEAVADEADQGDENGGGSGGGGGGGGGAASKAWQQLMRRLSNLPLALGEMAALAALSSVGTVIEQNKACNLSFILMYSFVPM